VNALNAISYDDATKAARARYIAFYDPELAHRWRTGTATTPDDMQKLQLLRRFERAEWQLLGKEDEHFETAVYHGQWGAGMRSARQGEKDFTDQEASARSQAEMSMMVGMLGSMSSMPTASMSPQMRLQSSMNMLSSDISVVAQQQETDQKLASISASFGARMRDINAEGVQFLFAVGNATMNIQARSLADLRVKMRALYRHSLVAGSMPVPVPASTSGTTTAAAAPIVTSAPATKP